MCRVAGLLARLTGAWRLTTRGRERGSVGERQIAEPSEEVFGAKCRKAEAPPIRANADRNGRNYEPVAGHVARLHRTVKKAVDTLIEAIGAIVFSRPFWRHEPG